MTKKRLFYVTVMKQFTIHYILQLLIIYPLSTTLHLFSSTDGQVCETVHGEYGVCTKWRDCHGAKRDDKGNSYHCSRYRTCCTSHYTGTDDIERKSWLERLGDRRNSYRESKKKDDAPSSSDLSSSSLPDFSSKPLSSDEIPNLRIKGCGKRNTLTDFIVGGRLADHWPWMVAIFYRPEGSTTTTFQCGGTVISKRYILTAAHCLIDGSTRATPARITVRLGGLTPEGDGRIRRVAEIKIHQNYRSQLHYNDIALLKLTQEIQSKNVVPACLPSPGMYNSNFYQRNGTVIGWGFTDGDKVSSSTTLREAMVPVVSPKRCQKAYERINAYSLPRGIVDTQMCAGTNDGSRDACQGDSGGSLNVQDKSQIWNVVGIVSFGLGCAEAEYPGVYTRVAKYLPWIARNTDIPAKYS